MTAPTAEATAAAEAEAATAAAEAEAATAAAEAEAEAEAAAAEETPPTTPPPKPAAKKTAADTRAASDKAALQKALAAERKENRAAQARVAELEAAQMSDTDKAWQDKLDLAEAANAKKLKLITARAALSTAGLTGKPDKLVALLNLDDILISADGDVSGVEDQVNALREEFPGLFKPTTEETPPAPESNGKTPATPGKVNIGNRKTAPTPPKSFAETLARQITGA